MKSYVKSYECCTYPKVCINYVYIHPNPNPNPISSRPPLPPRLYQEYFESHKLSPKPV